MFDKVEKAFYAINRKGIYPAAITPLNPRTVHPVYTAHAKILQPRTKPIFLSNVKHVIGRPHQSFLQKDCKLISEVEGAAGVAPLEYSKARYDIKGACKYTDELIIQGKLRSIIYQSNAAFSLQSQYASSLMNSISTVITQVPDSTEWNSVHDKKERLQILVIASNPIPKGVFLLEHVLRELDRLNILITLRIVTSKAYKLSYEGRHEISYIVTNRLESKQKQELFSGSNFLLNISPMDTLGTFLDSIKYGVPLITVEGQHASSYVINNVTGYIVESPLFYYSDKLGKDYFDVKSSFSNYVLSQNISFWDVLVKSLIDVFIRIENDSVKNIMSAHRDNCYDNFKLTDWLLDYQYLYEKVNEKI